jgi:hypothetical protein
MSIHLLVVVVVGVVVEEGEVVIGVVILGVVKAKRVEMVAILGVVIQHRGVAEIRAVVVEGEGQALLVQYRLIRHPLQ